MRAGRFADVTLASKLPAALLRAPAFGVWPADIDTDGDLDLVLAPRDGHPVVIRNNGDGTFTPRDLFPGVDARARLRVGRFRRRRRARRRLSRPGGRRSGVPQPARRQLPGRDAAAGIGGPQWRLPPRRPAATRVFDLLVLARDGTVGAALARAEDGTWRATDAVARRSARGVGAGRRAPADRGSRQQRRRGSDRRRARRARGCCSARPAARTRR